MARWSALCLVITCSWAGLFPRDVSSRAFEVRLLKGDEKNGAWGTDEFQANVNAAGTVRNVSVRGKELVSYAAALYTSPVPPGEKEGVRTVQGEQMGVSGLTVQPPARETRDDRGRRVFNLRHLVANKKVLGGKPLCQVDQKIVITPTGEISVSYECQWLETVVWHGFSLLVFFPKEGLQGCDFTLLSRDRILTGRLQSGVLFGGDRVREPYSRLTIWSPVGPFHFVWDAPSTCELSNQGGTQLSIQPTVVPYRSAIFRGLKDRMEYRILLPVSQQ